MHVHRRTPPGQRHRSNRRDGARPRQALRRRGCERVVGPAARVPRRVRRRECLQEPPEQPPETIARAVDAHSMGALDN